MANHAAFRLTTRKLEQVTSLLCPSVLVSERGQRWQRPPALCEVLCPPTAHPCNFHPHLYPVPGQSRGKDTHPASIQFTPPGQGKGGRQGRGRGGRVGSVPCSSSCLFTRNNRRVQGAGGAVSAPIGFPSQGHHIVPHVCSPGHTLPLPALIYGAPVVCKPCTRQRGTLRKQTKGWEADGENRQVTWSRGAEGAPNCEATE